MSDRLQWIDTTKVLAILLVLFVHIMESFHDAGVDGLMPTIKYFHAFLLTFFFITSGFFFKPKADSFWGEFKHRFLVRALPVFAFGLLMYPFNFVLEHNVNITEKHNALAILAMYLVGLPVLDWTTWFLVALFTAELVCYFFPPQRSLWVKLVGIVLLYSIGWWFSEIAAKSLFIITGFWFFREALIISSILIIGSLLRPYILNFYQHGPLRVFIYFVICLVVSLLTYDLNQIVIPPEEHRPVVVDRETVIMSLGMHGDYFLFMFTGLVGAMMCVFFGMLVPSFKPIPYLAKNSLLLIGLIGFFFHFINNPFAEALALEDRNMALLVSIAFAFVQLLLCIPGIWLLDKYLPQLFGKPNADGPILPPLTKAGRAKRAEARAN